MAEANITIERYVNEQTFIKKYDNWILSLRPNQITCYSMMLFAVSDAEQFSTLEPEILQDLGDVFADVERRVKLISDPLKFNYYSLMLVDPHVHFHIFPRFDNLDLDGFWPKTVDLQCKVTIDENELADRLQKLKDAFH